MNYKLKHIKTYKLFESPDVIYWKNKELFYDEDGAWAFGYKDGILYTSAERTHGHLVKNLDRDDFRYHGRIFTKQKLITFWEYPFQKDLKRIISELEVAIREKIWDNGYLIEIIDTPENSIDRIKYEPSTWGYLTQGIFIPLEDYVGSGDWDEETLKKQHVLSPMLKKRQISPEFWKIRAKKEKPLPFKQKIHQEKNSN